MHTFTCAQTHHTHKCLLVSVLEIEPRAVNFLRLYH